MPASAPLWRVPNRLAYIVNHSYPYSSNGYAVRTHGVAKALQQLGHSVIVINRPGSPWDSGYKSENKILHQQTIEGVRYLYTPVPSRLNQSGQAWQNAATSTLQQLLKLFKPAAVMAASNWENAKPALQAARAHNLPFYYEVRGFWEVTRLSREPEWQLSAEYQQIVDEETRIGHHADHLFTLNPMMQQELTRRGIKAAKISLVPNGWPELPSPPAVPSSTRNTLGLNSRHTIGYIGTFNEYEGLDDLIQATAQLVRQGIDLNLLLIGSGNQAGMVDSPCPNSLHLRQLADRCGLKQRLIIHHRLPQQQLATFYQLLDLVVIPRLPLPVTELVSPIKPLEAAAHGRPLLLSDVMPLKQLAEESGAALFRKGERSDLAKQIGLLLSDDHRRQIIGNNLRHWIEQQRLFVNIVQPIHHQIRQATSQQLTRNNTAAKMHPWKQQTCTILSP